MYLSAESKNKFVLSEDKFMKFKKGLVKNVLSAFLCVCLCGGMFAGCVGGDQEAENEFTLKFWPSGLGTEFFYNIVEDFERDTGYKVKVEENADTNGMYDTILLGEGYNPVDLYV